MCYPTTKQVLRANYAKLQSWYGSLPLAVDDDERDVVALIYKRLIRPEPEAFALANDPPRHKPQQFDNGSNTLQRVCVEGMDCLPGQLDLF